jgi:hypothetical protein
MRADHGTPRANGLEVERVSTGRGGKVRLVVEQR